MYKLNSMKISDSDRSKSKKKKKRSEKSRRSPSPLSKCMAVLSGREGETSGVAFGQGFSGSAGPDGAPLSDYDLRVCMKIFKKKSLT